MDFLTYLFAALILAFAFWRAIECYKENHLFLCSLYATFYLTGCLSFVVEEVLTRVVII